MSCRAAKYNQCFYTIGLSKVRDTFKKNILTQHEISTVSHNHKYGVAEELLKLF